MKSMPGNKNSGRKKKNGESKEDEINESVKKKRERPKREDESIVTKREESEEEIPMKTSLFSMMKPLIIPYEMLVLRRSPIFLT